MMKEFAYAMVIVVLGVSIATAQKKNLDGPLGLKWGMSTVQVRNAFKSRPGITFTSADTVGDHAVSVTYSGGSIGGHNIKLAVLSFHHDSLYQVAISIPYKNQQSELISTFTDLCSQLKEKYHTPEVDQSVIVEDFVQKNSQRTVWRSIANLGQDVMNVWFFGKNPQDTLTCILSTNQDNPMVILGYINGKINERAKAEKAKQVDEDL